MPCSQKEPDVPRQPKQPNKTEAAYRREILDRNPEIERIAYEPITVRLANGHRYTPDWGFVCGGRIHLVEVKGSYRMHSHQRARLAFDQARVEFPEITWIWAERQQDRTWRTR